jgi:predicted DNA-binding transcriptional regulator AlpA
MQVTTPEMFNKSHVCEVLGISPRGLENMVKRNEFPPPVRVGKQVYWTQKSLDRWRQRLFGAQENWAP